MTISMIFVRGSVGDRRELGDRGGFMSCGGSERYRMAVTAAILVLGQNPAVGTCGGLLILIGATCEIAPQNFEQAIVKAS